MNLDDLDNMSALLGDPAAMSYYPAPKTRGKLGRGSSGSGKITPIMATGFGSWKHATARSSETVGSPGRR